MHASLKKLPAVGFLVFVGLWAGGVVHSFALGQPELMATSAPIVSSIEEYRSGMRTANNLSQIGLTQTPLPQVLDQEDINQIRVYEKTAQVASGTSSFSDDEERLRKTIAAHQGVIFNEKATGIAPERRLSLGIGVHPDRFDALLHALTQVGQLGSINVQQQDRTGEFRRLHTQRQSLKKHQEAILKLRGANNQSVEETLKLEQKVQEIDKEIQSVGVQLGDLLGKEPSYNLFVTLQEYQPGSRQDHSFTLTRRLGNAFLWALGWWGVGMLGIGLFAGTALSIRTLWPARHTAASAASAIRGS
jgi:hypothetical protein